MNTTIIKKDFWKSDEYIEFHLDTKILYFYLLSCPDKGYLKVFKLEKHVAVTCTGISKNSIEAGLEQLQAAGFVDMFEGYVGLLKDHVSAVGGEFGAINTRRELERMPVNIREHFELDDETIISKEAAKKVAKKPGPPPETITSIIGKQPSAIQQALFDFVADRIERKRPPTTRAVKGWINNLEAMYPNDTVRQAQSIAQSIDMGWTGLFKIKEDTKKESAFL